ncbi:MAG: 23S rRNA (uracil(1939)-C(5))-methyltransferase RlmD [Atopobiaceae bacterium]|nr:23S rRNA (uracil(1939)-C(5))-methyltransferase RlmD [Atopobiaceae bacterium]
MGYRTYTCPIARECGGCEWLAVPYPIQLKRKQEAVEALLGSMCTADGAELRGIVGMDTLSWVDAGLPPAGGEVPDVENGVVNVDGVVAIESDQRAERGLEPIAYRHKAATPFAPGKGSRVRSGFFMRGTHRIVACDSCLVEDPRCRRVLNAVAKAAEELRIPAYDEDKGTGSIRHAIVRTDLAGKELLLTVVVNGDSIAHEHGFVARLRELAPEVTSLVLNSNTRKTNAMLGNRSRVLFGKGTVHDELLGCGFEIGPTSFYQTNPAQTEALYRSAIEGVLDGCGSGERLRMLDAYCGLGTIGICAARIAEDQGIELSVLGVELGGEAIAGARRNAEANGVAERCTFVATDATEYLRSLAKRTAPGQDADGIEAVVLDPPRAGTTLDFIRAVNAIGPKRVVYVSCNPETLARDLGIFRSMGWRIRTVTPVDMFPHTKHIETVVLLDKGL